MKYCLYCGEELVDDTIFCHHCGKQLKINKELQAMECLGCGASLKYNETSDVIRCEYCGREHIIDDEASKLRRLTKAKMEAEKAEQKIKVEQKIQDGKIKLMDYFFDNPVLCGLLAVLLFSTLANLIQGNTVVPTLILIFVIIFVIHDQEKEKKGFKTNPGEKNKWITFILCFFLGMLGAHKFYEGKIGLGILYFATCGLFIIGWFVDIILILLKPNPYYVETDKKKKQKTTML